MKYERTLDILYISTLTAFKLLLTFPALHLLLTPVYYH